MYGCGGGGRISAATRVDFAKAAATVLCTNQLSQNIFELAGSESFSLSEFAEEVSRQAGKQIHYVDLTEMQYREALIQAGLPEHFAELLANSEAGVSKGDLFDESGQLGQLLGGETISLQKAIREALS
jgi:NAD(P)H dehydrogenase (quinone)